MSDVLHYGGDKREFDWEQVLGPDMYGAIYHITGVEYDAAANLSTATLTVIAPHLFQDLRVKHMQKFIDSARIMKLFGKAPQ